MAAESNVGARIFLIGKDATLAGVREITAAVAKLNATIADGAKASASAADADDAQAAAIARMNLAMDAYKANLAETQLATDSLVKVGKYAFWGLTTAAAAWTYESVKWAQSYQTALVQLQTQAALTARATRAIGLAAKANAADLGISPTAYVQAAYHPASAGFNLATVNAITQDATRLAKIGGSSSETTVNALTGVMKAYGLKSGRSSLRSTALLNAIIGAGNMHASTLVGALSTGVATTAKTFGVSLSSLGSAIAFLTDRSIPARQAGTHLRMTLALLGGPSEESTNILKAAGMTTQKILSSRNSMSQMLQEAGVTSTQLGRALRTNKGYGGIYNALALLHHTLTAAGLTRQMQGAMISRTFGGGRMGTTMESLYNTLGTLAKKDTKIRHSGTSTQFMKDWAKETHTLDFQLSKLGATIETLGTSFGTKLIPPLTKAVSLFTDMLKWFDKNKWAAIALGGAVSAVLVPAMGLYLYRALFKTSGAIRTVLQGYGNLIRGNHAEQTALKQTSAQLTLTSDETENLARKNGMLAGSAESAAGKIALATKAEETNVGAADADALASERLGAADTAAGGAALEGGAGLSGRISGMGGKLMTAGGYAFGGYLAGSMIRGNNGSTVHRGQSLTDALRSEGGDIATGAGMGAAIGSIIPGVGTLIGGGVGAGVGALYGVRHQVGADVKGVWDDIKHVLPPANPVPPIVIHTHVHLKDKEIAKSVTRVSKRDAARSG